MMPKPIALALVLTCSLLPSMAQQRPQYMPGQWGLNAGIMPSPGFTYADLNLDYYTARLNDANGNKVPGIEGSFNVWTIENVFEYVPNLKALPLLDLGWLTPGCSRLLWAGT